MAILSNTNNGPVLNLTGTGSPEGVVVAPVGSLFAQTDGSANSTLWIKQSGVGNTGWQHVSLFTPIQTLLAADVSAPGAFANLLTAAVTTKFAASNILVSFTASALTGAAITNFKLQLDGVDVPLAGWALGALASHLNTTKSILVPAVTAAAHTIAVQWTSAGVTQIRAATQPAYESASLWIVESP